MKRLFSFIILFAFLQLGCSKDRIFNQLEGSWDVKNYFIGGYNSFGSLGVPPTFSSIEIKFGPYNDSKGDLTWSQLSAYTGDTEVFTGKYTSDPDSDKIFLKFYDTIPFEIEDFEDNPFVIDVFETEFDLILNKHSLKLKGEINSISYIIEASRN